MTASGLGLDKPAFPPRSQQVLGRPSKSRAAFLSLPYFLSPPAWSSQLGPEPLGSPSVSFPSSLLPASRALLGLHLQARDRAPLGHEASRALLGLRLQARDRAPLSYAASRALLGLRLQARDRAFPRPLLIGLSPRLLPLGQGVPSIVPDPGIGLDAFGCPELLFQRSLGCRFTNFNTPHAPTLHGPNVPPMQERPWHRSIRLLPKFYSDSMGDPGSTSHGRLLLQVKPDFSSRVQAPSALGQLPPSNPHQLPLGSNRPDSTEWVLSASHGRLLLQVKPDFSSRIQAPSALGQLPPPDPRQLPLGSHRPDSMEWVLSASHGFLLLQVKLDINSRVQAPSALGQVPPPNPRRLPLDSHRSDSMEWVLSASPALASFNVPDSSVGSTPRPRMASASAPPQHSASYGLGLSSHLAPPSASYGLGLSSHSALGLGLGLGSPSALSLGFPLVSDSPWPRTALPRHSASDQLPLGLDSKASATSMGHRTPTCRVHVHGSRVILLLFHAATS